MTTSLESVASLIWRLFFHDIMNHLGVAKLSLELALMIESQPMELENTLNGMENTIKLYDRFLRIDHGPMDLKQIIDKVNKMLGATVEIKHCHCQSKMSKIELDSVFIAIFYNLAANSLKHSGLSQEDLILTIEIKEGEVIFADNGKGVEEGKNLFTPKHALGIIQELGRKLGFSIEEIGVPGGAHFSMRFT